MTRLERKQTLNFSFITELKLRLLAINISVQSRIIYPLVVGATLAVTLVIVTILVVAGFVVAILIIAIGSIS